MKDNLIKIGHQTQANKDIFLYHNGTITCGRFLYKDGSGRFKKIYDEIISYSTSKRLKNVLDVSEYKIWDATTIYDEYILKHWLKSISSKTVEKMANETIIRKFVDSIKPDFKKALNKKWKKIFNEWKDKNDPNTPRNSWQII